VGRKAAGTCLEKKEGRSGKQNANGKLSGKRVVTRFHAAVRGISGVTVANKSHPGAAVGPSAMWRELKATRV